MPSFASLTDPKPYHILSYGTLLGSTFFQSFIAGPFAFYHIPRAQFATLQSKIFPTYFALQTALPAILALTWPGEKVAGTAMRKDVGWRGVFGQGYFYDALLPIGLMFGTGLLNLVLLGPMTTKVMKERKHQETRDGKKYFDPGPKSAEMQRLNSMFGKLHGASSLSNLIGLGAMLFYAAVLADRL